MSNEEENNTLAAYWQQQIQSWETSGQSQAAFCRTNDLSYHRFGYWRRKTLPPIDSPFSHSPSGFVPVAITHTPTNDLSLTLPNGLVLSGITAGNLPVVGQLLNQLS